MSSEPQTDICLVTVPITDVLVTGPDGASNEATVFAIPDGANFRVELLSVSYIANTLPIDGSANVNFDLEYVDDSDSDAVVNLLATFTLDDNRTAVIVNPVWRGSQIMEAGDVINLEFDVADPDTAAQGAAVVLEYKILRHSDDPRDTQVNITPIDKFLIGSPLTTTTGSLNECLLACPDQAGYRIELVSVSYVAHTLPADAGDVDVDIEYIDDSDSDDVSDLITDFDLKSGTARVVTEIWRGSQVLDPGDVINAQFTTDGGLTTPAQGASLITEFRILKRS